MQRENRRVDHPRLSRDDSFGVLASIFILVGLGIAGAIVGLIEIALTGITPKYSPLLSAVTLVLYLPLPIAVRPRILLLSHWTLRLRDFVIAVVSPLLIQFIPLLFVADPKEYFTKLTVGIVTCAVVLVPLLEEVLIRGIVLRSLLARSSSVIAILLTSALFSLLHPNFWESLPRQILLSLVYTATDFCLSASIVAHMVSNAVIFLPFLASVFKQLHIYTICR